MATYNESISESANATVMVTARTRTGLAPHHLLAAARFTVRIGVVERENAGQPLGEFWEEVLQHSLAVATLTVACVECYANELFFEQSAITPHLSPAAARLIADSLDRDPILRRYAAVYAIRTGKELALGADAIQDMDRLIRLRNAVVHFRPEWFEEQAQHAKLSRQLQYRFDATPFLLPAEPLFPRAWASHSFAVWALRSTVTFLDYFFEQVGLPCPLSPFRARLTALSGGAV
jgi:hypothetical protein